jgi:hypothetical protein
MKMTVAELIKILQAAPNPDAEVYVVQPRTWTKKQPNNKKTQIQTIGTGHYQVYIETIDVY